MSFVAFKKFEPGEFGEILGSGKSSLCFSGGGAVACATMTGILRSLYQHDLLDSSIICCICANSAGSWALTSLLFENTDGTTPSMNDILAPIYSANLKRFTTRRAHTPVSNISLLFSASTTIFQHRVLHYMSKCPLDRYDQAWSLAFGDTC